MAQQSDPFFFGYGSLVNRRTHAYPDAHLATIRGWRREWRFVPALGQTFLTAMPDTHAQIDGLVARVPGADWAALDMREAGYARHLLSADTVAHQAPVALSAQVYAVPPDGSTRADAGGTISLSYLDVVVQGFLAEFSVDGVRRFFDSTTGWQTPIIDDRAAPLYPRAQMLSDTETALVDAEMARIGARVVR